MVRAFDIRLRLIDPPLLNDELRVVLKYRQVTNTCKVDDRRTKKILWLLLSLQAPLAPIPYSEHEHTRNPPLQRRPSLIIDPPPQTPRPCHKTLDYFYRRRKRLSLAHQVASVYSVAKQRNGRTQPISTPRPPMPLGYRNKVHVTSPALSTLQRPVLTSPLS